MTDTVEKVVVKPFEEMTKAEQVEHLIEIHGINSMYGHHLSAKTKVTKDEMERLHRATHAVMEAPDVQVSANALWLSSDGQRTRAKNPNIDHVHEEVKVTITDVQAEQIKAAKEGGQISAKPLSIAERKVLTDLVSNDFKVTEQQIREMAADALQGQIDDLKKERVQKDAKAEKFKAKRAEIIAKANAQLRAEVAKLNAEGITVDRWGIAGSEGGWSLQFGYEKYDKEAERVRKENHALLNRALIRLEGQKQVALRRILLSGITKEAAALLETVPTAKELMVEAERQQAALTSGSDS